MPNSVPRTRKTLYIRFDASIVEMLDTLCAVGKIDHEHAISVMIEETYDAYLTIIAKKTQLELDKNVLLAQIEDIDHQLKLL